MKILGIDPGMAIVGYSLVDYDGKVCKLLKSGSIQTKKGTREASRLLEIMEDMTTIVEAFKPDVASIEKLFFFRNQTTVMPVAHARGIILAILEKYGVPIFEYTQMVKLALGTDLLPKLDDTVDSIAIAICHTRSII